MTVRHGDCLEVLPTLPAGSVDAVVTDPPYELGFMGRAWDASGIAYNVDLWRECLRVLKPGGHLLAFGGTRTVHRLTCAIEDAGFEIRDGIDWLYASGFPKSLDVSKAIDKANGRRFEDRYVLGRHLRERREAAGLTRAEVNEWFGYSTGCEHWESQHPAGARVPTLADWRVLRERLGLSEEYDELVERAEAAREVIGPGGRSGKARGSMAGDFRGEWDSTAPATDDARRWSGWGTALKPAREPIVMARKPLAGTVAANVQAYGTGALNIDASRVPGGRWPANVILSHAPDCAEQCVPGCPVAELDRQSEGTRAAKPSRSGSAGVGESVFRGMTRPQPVDHGGSGASRFFPVFRYQAKAPAGERPKVDGVAHPTVKPLALMRWLVQLVTPPGGTVLDPFAGSGTTLEACALDGFHGIGIERDESYLPLINARMARIPRQREADAA